MRLCKGKPAAMLPRVTRLVLKTRCCFLFAVFLFRLTFCVSGVQVRVDDCAGAACRAAAAAAAAAAAEAAAAATLDEAHQE